MEKNCKEKYEKTVHKQTWGEFRMLNEFEFIFSSRAAAPMKVLGQGSTPPIRRAMWS